jgi:hypothetical protein
MKPEGVRMTGGGHTVVPFRPATFILQPSACILLFLLTGCAHYEYDVVQPPDLAGHVPERAWVSLRRGELDYRLRSYDNRLVMRVYNRGERAVKLLGTDSAAVDPRGESHPLQSATIPPGSFVSRIFPPPRPRVERYGPTFGIGVGASYGAAHGPHGYRYRDPFYSGGFDDFGPRYYSVYDPNDRSYFNWPGESSVRFLFVFQPGNGDPLRHEFVIRRRKM